MTHETIICRSCFLASTKLHLFVVAVLLTGCSVIPQYPTNLPSLVKADTTLEVCPPIDGIFSDSGTATTPDGRKIGNISLTHLLHPRAEGFQKANVVVVKGPIGDAVEIESLDGQQRLASWRQSKVTKESYLAKGDRVVGETYLCQDGFVRLGRAYGVGGGGTTGLVVLAVKSDFLWLRKAIDGSLIMLHTNWDYAALNFIFPVGHSDKIWYRFPPATIQINTNSESSESLHIDRETTIRQ